MNPASCICILRPAMLRRVGLSETWSRVRSRKGFPAFAREGIAFDVTFWGPPAPLTLISMASRKTGGRSQLGITLGPDSRSQERGLVSHVARCQDSRR